MYSFSSKKEVYLYLSPASFSEVSTKKSIKSVFLMLWPWFSPHELILYFWFSPKSCVTHFCKKCHTFFCVTRVGLLYQKCVFLHKVFLSFCLPNVVVSHHPDFCEWIFMQLSCVEKPRSQGPWLMGTVAVSQPENLFLWQDKQRQETQSKSAAARG